MDTLVRDGRHYNQTILDKPLYLSKTDQSDRSDQSDDPDILDRVSLHFGQGLHSTVFIIREFWGLAVLDGRLLQKHFGHCLADSGPPFPVFPVFPVFVFPAPSRNHRPHKTYRPHRPHVFSMTNRTTARSPRTWRHVQHNIVWRFCQKRLPLPVLAKLAYYRISEIMETI